MFEFHGWATIRADDTDDADLNVKRDREVVAVTRLREAIKEADDQFSLFEVRQTGNGLIVLNAHGLRNHRFHPVIELFRWVSMELPDSYGLLYVQDDEADGQQNEFRVWRLALGAFEERADPFLSPYMPTVELPIFSSDARFAMLGLLDQLRATYKEEDLDELADDVTVEQATFLRRLADRALEISSSSPG